MAPLISVMTSTLPTFGGPALDQQLNSIKQLNSTWDLQEIVLNKNMGITNLHSTTLTKDK